MRASPLDPPAKLEPRAALAAALRCVGLGGAPALELDTLASRLAAAAVVGAATGRPSVLAAAAALVPGAAASHTLCTHLGIDCHTLCTLTNEQACGEGTWTADACGDDQRGAREHLRPRPMEHPQEA